VKLEGYVTSTLEPSEQLRHILDIFWTQVTG